MSVALVGADDWNGHMGGGAWWVWMPVMLVVVGAVLVAVVALVVRSVHTGGPPSESADEGRTARVIAMERYARGEISAEEYDALLQRLR